MQDKTVYLNGSLSDLNPRRCGYQTVHASSKAIPSVYAFTAIHYVDNGSGTLFKNECEFKIGAGDVFIIKKGETVLCRPAPESSLSYYFISFDGNLASDFETLPPFFKGEKNIFEKINDIEASSSKSVSLLSAYLFEIYSKYCTLENSGPVDYVDRIKEYIESNYQNDIRIEQISSLLHLSRGYIARIFKKRTGMTVIEYLNIYRLDQAERFLKSGKSITEAAYLSGFSDLSNFSKKFKNHTGISPGKYKASSKGELL